VPVARTWDRVVSFGSELFRRVIASSDGQPAESVLRERDNARSSEAEPDMASGSLFARYFTETSGRPVVEALVNRRPLQRFHRLLHNDIERD
jgi:putative ATP-dependent endonuclease of the OLD family